MSQLVTLPNLYTNPNAIMKRWGVEGTQLRLDDANMATGQTIQTTADNPAGSTTITVAPLESPLLPGSVLQFDGGGVPQLVQVILTSTGLVGATQLQVQALQYDLPALAYAQDSGVTTYLASLLVEAASIATGRVKSYCCGRYDDSVLGTAWSVYNWATVIATKWIADRRGQGSTDALVKEYEETMKELKAVRIGNLDIEDIGTRTSGWPFFSNVTIDIRYDYNKMRVEPQLSEGTPTAYAQFVDWNAVFSIQF